MKYERYACHSVFSLPFTRDVVAFHNGFDGFDTGFGLGGHGVGRREPQQLCLENFTVTGVLRNFTECGVVQRSLLSSNICAVSVQLVRVRVQTDLLAKSSSEFRGFSDFDPN